MRLLGLLDFVSQAATAAPILREYLRKTPITKPYFDAAADTPLEEFAAEARRHPVFKLGGAASRPLHRPS